MKFYILGAGASGLALAYYLSKFNQDPLSLINSSNKSSQQNSPLEIILIEARDRIGGRAYTCNITTEIPNLSVLVEFGAEFIHGQNTSTHNFLNLFNLSKAILFERASQMQIEEENKATFKTKSKNLDRITQMINDYNNLENTNWEKEEDISLGEYFQNKGYSRKEIEFADILFAQTCCSSIFKLSILDLSREMKVDISGEKEFRIIGGYNSLFQKMKEELFQNSNVKILYSTQVTQIDYSNSQKIKIKCEGDTIYEADKICVTFPIEIIKQEKVTFLPPLPKIKKIALDYFQTEPATKLVFIFQKKIFDFNYLITKKTSRWWTNQLFLKKNFQEIQIVSNYLTCDFAKKVDGEDEEKILNEHLKYLCEIYNLSYDLILKNLIYKKRISWGNDPFALGGYASIQPSNFFKKNQKLSNFENPREIFSKNIENRIFFAGEGTNYHSNFQTVHGAFDSAARCFREILISSSKL